MRSLSQIGTIPMINKYFLYIPDNEIEGDILGWNPSHNNVQTEISFNTLSTLKKLQIPSQVLV